MSPKAEENQVIYFADAQMGSTIIEQGEGYFVMPLVITRQDVYDYGKTVKSFKPWAELEKVGNYDGTPFIAHHPLKGQTQAGIPVWGEIRNSSKDPEKGCISAEVKIFEDKAPAEFCKDAKAGKAQPVSWGYTSRRVAETGTYGDKDYTHADYDMSSLHVAFAPPPWTARCSKCATNVSTVEDAEADGSMGDEGKPDGEGEGTKNDAFNMALLPDKIDELLLISSDFDLGQKARVLLAQVRSALGEGNVTGDAQKGAGGQKPADDGKNVQGDASAKKPDVKPDDQQKVQMDEGKGKVDATPKIEDKQPPAADDLLPKIGAMLDAKMDSKLTPVMERLGKLEGIETTRQTQAADAALADRKAKFDGKLSEAGKSENKDGKLYTAFDAAEDKVAAYEEFEAKGYWKHDAEPGTMQGDAALPPLGGEEAGRKQRVRAMAEKAYPNLKKDKEA